MAKNEKQNKPNPADVRTEVVGNSNQQEDQNPLVEQDKVLAEGGSEVQQTAREESNTVGFPVESTSQSKATEQEQELQQEMTRKVQPEGAEELRKKVYNTADRAAGIGTRPLSAEGTPLTDFEQESQWFFKEQNELEAEIDAVEVSREKQAQYAGETVTVFQSGDMGPVGSATVTTYAGETIHPYPPTDYNAPVITAADLTADPTLGEMGLVAGDPMPPENNVHDLRETDGRVDTKDYMRRLRKPNDLILESRRTKYPSTEAPA